ncbi:TlpA disulfide reductase family protein [Bacillus sp. 165]|uniref:TlpA disulfide reductase family protein n=1 Tax=Bacillus sp. 165 TaxID=1529117 RepID=UPI001ADB69F6|nr:TlpA disulfide reductase family protein [Bacillus sp. 165]MBO9130860.1 TlpA family protein disulfide reductase [Bacillus sp. 165]
MNKYIIIALLLALAGWAVLHNTLLVEKSVNEPSDSDAPIGLKTPNAAPYLSLPQLDGSKIQTSDLKGKKVMLNFWTTWCPPCRAEMPELEQFYKNMSSDGIEVVAVNLTESENSIENVKSFKDKNHLTFPILLDEKGIYANRFEIISVPTTYFLDENGIIRFKHVGPMSYEMIKEYMDKM